MRTLTFAKHLTFCPLLTFLLWLLYKKQNETLNEDGHKNLKHSSSFSGQIVNSLFSVKWHTLKVNARLPDCLTMS